jgi:RNA polymerase sigma-70 factor, ECF subfamily
MRVSEFEEIIENTKHTVLVAIKQHLDRHLYDFIDDVMQETYLRVYKKINKNNDIKVLENYMYIIAKNESFRINKKEKKYIGLLNEQQENLNEENDVFEDIINIIIALPGKYKQVAELFYINKLSLLEISNQLEISVGAIKSRLFRSRNMVIKQAKLMELI